MHRMQRSREAPELHYHQLPHPLHHPTPSPAHQSPPIPHRPDAGHRPGWIEEDQLVTIRYQRCHPKQYSDTVLLKPEHTSEGCKQIAGPSPRVLLEQVWGRSQKCACLINSQVMLMLLGQGAPMRTRALMARSLPIKGPKTHRGYEPV